MTCNCDNDGSNEYIIELNQQGPPGRKGEKGDTGYAPTVNYVSNSNAISFNIVNETSIVETPALPLYDYLVNNYVTNTSLANTLADYSTSAEIAQDYYNKTQIDSQVNTINSALNGKMNTDGSNSAGTVQFRTITSGGSGALTLSGNNGESRIVLGNNGLASEIALAADYIYANGKQVATKDELTSKLNTNGNNATIPFWFGRDKFVIGYADSENGHYHVTRILSYPYYDSALNLNYLYIYRNENDNKVHLSGNENRHLVLDATTRIGQDKEIATVDNIGNGTITLTQGGVTKGTFTTNQSGNTTIDLDAGGDISNKLDKDGSNADTQFTVNGVEITSGGIYDNNSSSYFSYSLGTYELGRDSSGCHLRLPGYNLTCGATSVTLNSTMAINRNNPDSKVYYHGASASNELAIKGDLPTTMTGADSVTGGAAGLVPAPAAGDQDKYLKGDGTWSTVTSGTTYTAGTGIDITNDVISVDSTTVAMQSDIPTDYVKLTTDQTISGFKTFTDGLKSYTVQANQVQLYEGNASRQVMNYQGGVNEIEFGNTSNPLRLKGKNTRPTYYDNNYNETQLALYSDIPSMTNYYTKTEVDAELATKQDELTAGDGINIETQTIDVVTGFTTNSSSITSDGYIAPSMTSNVTITTGTTLSYIAIPVDVTKKQLITTPAFNISNDGSDVLYGYFDGNGQFVPVLCVGEYYNSTNLFYANETPITTSMNDVEIASSSQKFATGNRDNHDILSLEQWQIHLDGTTLYFSCGFKRLNAYFGGCYTFDLSDKLFVVEAIRKITTLIHVPHRSNLTVSLNDYGKYDLENMLTSTATLYDTTGLTNLFDLNSSSYLAISCDNTIARVSDLPDMSNYYTKTEVDTELADKQDELTFGNGWQTPSNMNGPQQYGYIVTESAYTSNAGWHCFNGKWDVSEEGWWSGNNPGPWWVKIELPEAGIPTEWVIKNEVATPSNFKDGKIQGSNDNSTWDDLYVITDRPDTTGYIETYMLSTNTAYKYLRIYVTDTYSGTVAIQQMSIKGKYVSNLTTDTLTSGNGIGFNNKKLTYDIIGKPTIVNNVMSNASGSNYLITDFSPNGQPWEIKAKVTTGSSLGNCKFITGNSGTDSDIHGPAFGIDGDRWAMSLSSSPGGYYDIGVNIKGSYVPLTNTTYYLKFGWTGTLYYIDYSLDGETYTRDSTRESSLSIQNGNMLIGNSIPGSGYSWNGTIDLKEFYINNVPACATTNDITINFDPTAIPGYSASGTYVLKLVNGIVQWVSA